MKARRKEGIHKPFKNLKSLLESNSVPVSSFPAEKVLFQRKGNIENDEELFQAAMADVTPLASANYARFETIRKTSNECNQWENEESAENYLKDLVECGKGFVVEHTPEYMEWAGPEVCREISGRLHRGQFSIQSYIDLHGFTVSAAKETFEHFLKDAVMSGKRGILVVHGRGLSSPREPVLKTNVYKWLTKGPWRKWIIAFASARSCDGGAGATYVLLRHRPLTKRHRKKKS